tara:strand:- start:144 stop:506 length:363 start_codon:yes stop_codon:yes gene_type:complete
MSTKLPKWTVHNNTLTGDKLSRKKKGEMLLALYEGVTFASVIYERGYVVEKHIVRGINFDNSIIYQAVARNLLPKSIKTWVPDFDTSSRCISLLPKSNKAWVPDFDITAMSLHHVPPNVK